MKTWIILAIMCIENVNPMYRACGCFVDNESQRTYIGGSILSDVGDCIVQGCQMLSGISESYVSNSSDSPIYALFDDNNEKVTASEIMRGDGGSYSISSGSKDYNDTNANDVLQPY